MRYTVVPDLLPLKIASGRDFDPFPELPSKEELPSSLQGWLDSFVSAWSIMQTALQKAQKAYKHFADKKRTDYVPFSGKKFICPLSI